MENADGSAFQLTCVALWLALSKTTLTRIRAPVMKCNKGGVTGKTDVAGTRTTQQRIVQCVQQVDSLGLRPRDQKVVYRPMRPLEGRNVVWRFAACYHMWLLTLVLVFIPLPHMC